MLIDKWATCIYQYPNKMKPNLHLFEGNVQPLTAKIFPSLPVHSSFFFGKIGTSNISKPYPKHNHMKTSFTNLLDAKKSVLAPLMGLFLFLVSFSASAQQLGIYQFTGASACPNQNPAITAQPANATFSDFINVGNGCHPIINEFAVKFLNLSNVFDPNQYNQFTLSPANGYTLTLTNLSFKENVNQINTINPTTWFLRSSLDNYTSNLATGTSGLTATNVSVNLPAASFTNIGEVSFRFYIINVWANGTQWYHDDVTLSGTTNFNAPLNPANPTSNSPQSVCTGVTLTANGTPPVGETWYWQTSANGTSTANSATSWTVFSTDTYYIRSRNNTTLIWSSGRGSASVVVTGNVAAPVFAMGATSTRCKSSNSVTYSATAANSTGITYSLDAASISAGLSINSSTGELNYNGGRVGVSVITATATGCGGPVSSTHTATTNDHVDDPVFSMGASSNRCAGAGSVTYSATANFSTGITYSLNAAALSAGNTINSATGAVNYVSGWLGSAIITATATGCNGPKTSTHTASTNGALGTPVFSSGSASTRCQGSGSFTYSATAANSTSINYSLDAASISGGNTINAATGEVTFAAGWTGTTSITASAAGCGGPLTAVHTVTITASVATPVFTSGASSTRCQGAETVTYTATANFSTGITYSLNAAALSAGNTINSATGAVNYVAGWTGSTTVTATASGCNGPKSATHTVNITPTVGLPIFSMGATSTRCQGAGTQIYDATASNSTGITYSLDAASISFGNSINAATGEVTYLFNWNGTSTITATAAGCNGPATSTHTVTITPTVGIPVFTLGINSTRCQGANAVTYTANATNSTGIIYSLDGACEAAGNTINPSTGEVTYVVGWVGTSVVTAEAAGCNGPKYGTHTVTTNPSVGTPVFTLGNSSFRCVGAGTVTYSATAANSTGVSYSLDALTAAFPGNTINSTNGQVTYALTWVGTTTITATATGCEGPKTATHTVTINAAVSTPVFTSGASSTRCQGAGNVSYTANASNTSGITYSLDAPSISGGNAINAATGEVTYSAGWSGTTTITASAAGCSGPKTANHTVTVTPTVGTPVFTLGATSTRCQAAGTVTYSASSSNSTSRTYSLDAASLSGGNSINSSTGAVTYVAGWSGSSTITVSAAGCNGPATASHTVTTTPTVGIPIFTMGASSVRCQGSGSLTYDATASNTTGITYSLDAASLSGGNIINGTTGFVTYAAGWSGTTTITASAAGCNGPRTATHTVTVTPTVGTPVFVMGATSTRCNGAGTLTYTANATNNTGITYSLDAASAAAGITINAATGAVTFIAGWTNNTVITAAATGCNGPSTASHTVTNSPTIGTPVFTLGAASVRCQGSAFVTYTATASNATSILYSLDAASTTGGCTINATTGVVVYPAGWSGATTITATANGCNGPTTAAHAVTVTPTVGTPVFTSGGTSTKCQGAGNVTYTANATNTTAITYSLDGSSTAAGNTIDATTGEVTYVAGWNGTSTITASAAGCNGPKTANHTVTITPTVGTPVFSLGLQTVRTQGAGTVTYGASASNNTGITYSLDAASLSAGNTINTATGAVTWVAGWFGLSSITASANGCNGPSLQTHIVNINPGVVQTPLYLSGPGQFLDRIDPVATNLTVTRTSYPISSGTAGISIDASNTVTGLGTPISVSHTTGAGANRLMLVGISQKNKTVLSVTYGGTPLTLVGDNNINGNARIALYALVNPPSGTANVVVNFSSAPDKGAVVNVTTYINVNQTTPLGTFVTDQNRNATPSLTVVSAAGELVYDVIAVRSGNTTPAGGQTQRWNMTSGQEIEGAGSTKAGAVSTTMSWTNSGSLDWAMGAVAIKPAASINNITFTQAPVLCSPLTIKAQTIQMLLHLNINSGSMPANPAITAQLKYGSTNILTLSNPVYSDALKLISWTGTLGADVTIPAGQALELVITSAQPDVQFQIEYNSASKPSRISLLPVSTFIDFVSFDVYDAPYPGGIKKISGLVNTTYYARAVITTPFGYADITGMDIKINPPGNTVPVNCVDSSTCTRTYEYTWTTSGSTGMYYLLGTAKEGYENLIKNSDILSFDICSFCPPVALNDSATGAGGAPMVVNVLANDYDPNNNMNLSTLAINTQPTNGQAFISNNRVVYLPNGSFAGKDTLVYQICDSTNACATAYVYLTVNPLIVDPCSDAAKTHTYFIPYPEQDALVALKASASNTAPSNNIRTVISLTMPYPGMTIVWDHWEDGYEVNPLDPLQASTRVWGDGNPYNGIAPGYASDIIPAGGSIVLDNTMPAMPRVASNIFFDGKDKITSSGQVAITQVCGEPTWMPVQAIKTNVTSTFDFGQSFTIPLGENFNSRDFRYTALFVRAQFDSTYVDIDKDNNGSFETSFMLNQGQSFLVNGGVRFGATVASDKPIGVELNAGGVDQYSIRNSPIFPATWYSHTYYTPVPTSDNSGDSPKDSSVVMFYNSLNRPLTINWFSGAPANGTINLPAKGCVRFPLAYSTTNAYKFVNPTGESYTAIEIVDSYTPGGGGNDGQTYDWSFNLISEARLTDFATTAWAPGGLDLVAPPGPDVNGNPVWVTPNANTTIYVKWNGDISGTSGLVSPCGLRYDVSYNVNELKYIKLRDPSDNDQSGLAVYTCNGAKLAAVYGEDAQGSGTGIGVAYWDVGTTIQPFCKQKLIFANDDFARTMVNQPVTIPILLNDFGFLAVVDPSTVTTAGLLHPRNGSVTVNANGTVIYLPNPGFTGKDTFEYRVCSTPAPVICDVATVYVDIAVCPAPYTQNVIAGQVFNDKNDDGIYNDGGTGIANAKVYLYVDGNCNQVAEPTELRDSVITDSSGSYQFISYPEKFVLDDFDDSSGNRTCANGSDGNAAWLSDWTDLGDPSTGFCNTSQSQANTDAEIYKDGTFSNAIRLKHSNVSVTRSVDLSGASYAFLSFSYRRKSATLTAGENILVQVSTNGTTFGTIFTIAGDGTSDANYVNIYNQDITAYAAANTRIRFLTNSNVDDQDTVYIDNVKIQFIRYPICYITKLDPSTVPAYHHTTTAMQHTLTAVNAQSCFGPFYFGIAKNKISISGTLYNDANGLTDNLVNGTAIGKLSGATMYAYLVDSTNTVVRRTTVNATTGTYSFSNADMFTNYSLRISTISVNLGDPPPADAGVSLVTGNWVPTGDAYGNNNAAGSGNLGGIPNCIVPVTTTSVNVSAVGVGVQRLPDSDDRVINYPRNDPNIQYDVTGGLTGSDPEDGILGAGKTYKITQLPFGSVLYYNGIAVSLNQVINSFNPALLKIDPDDDRHQAIFRYASMDAAGLFDPTPATVTVNWAQTLPVKLITFTGRLNGTRVDLNWVTANEINSKHFEVQRSSDARNYSTIATVAAKGNSSTVTSYFQVDPSPMNGINYYRLKMVDLDGSFEYSNVVIIRIENNMQLVTKIAPNPFTGKVDVYLTLTHNTMVDFRFIDMNGRIVFSKSVKGLKGFNWFTINDLERLPSAPYFLHIATDDATIVEKLIKQ